MDFKSEEAAVVSVEIGTKKAEFDIYSLVDIIRSGEEDHGEIGNERLNGLREVVAMKLDVMIDQIAFNQILDLREYVVTEVNRLDEYRKKRYNWTADSPSPIQEFPPTSEKRGVSEKNEPGLQTSQMSEPGELVSTS